MIIRSVDVVKKYIELLQIHDWYFEYSDDFRVWKRGAEAYLDLKGLYKQVPEIFAKDMWNNYAPDPFKLS